MLLLNQVVVCLILLLNLLGSSALAGCAVPSDLILHKDPPNDTPHHKSHHTKTPQQTPHTDTAHDTTQRYSFS